MLREECGPGLVGDEVSSQLAGPRAKAHWYSQNNSPTIQLHLPSLLSAPPLC